MCAWNQAFAATVRRQRKVLMPPELEMIDMGAFAPVPTTPGPPGSTLRGPRGQRPGTASSGGERRRRRTRQSVRQASEDDSEVEHAHFTVTAWSQPPPRSRPASARGPSNMNRALVTSPAPISVPLRWGRAPSAAQAPVKKHLRERAKSRGHLSDAAHPPASPGKPRMGSRPMTAGPLQAWQPGPLSPPARPGTAATAPGRVVRPVWSATAGREGPSPGPSPHGSPGGHVQWSRPISAAPGSPGGGTEWGSPGRLKRAWGSLPKSDRDGEWARAAGIIRHGRSLSGVCDDDPKILRSCSCVPSRCVVIIAAHVDESFRLQEPEHPPPWCSQPNACPLPGHWISWADQWPHLSTGVCPCMQLRV